MEREAGHQVNLPTRGGPATVTPHRCELSGGDNDRLNNGITIRVWPGLSEKGGVNTLISRPGNMIAVWTQRACQYGRMAGEFDR